MPIIKGAEPFLMPGNNDHGVLLIHGFTGSPSEMRLLGEYLNSLGYTVMAPRLTGHGTNVKEMSATKWPHWYGSVEDAYHLLSNMTKEVSVVGLSMGALMAMKLSIEYPVKSVASLSAPIYLNGKKISLLPIYKFFNSYVEKKRKSFEQDVDAQYSICYDHMPLEGIQSLLSLIKHVEQLLPMVNVPLFIAQSKAEHTVKPESANHIYSKVASDKKEIMWLEKSGHVITLDVERQLLYEAVAKFLQSH